MYRDLNRKQSIVLTFVVCCFISMMGFLMLPYQAFAWGNGDNYITSAFAKNAVPLASVDKRDAHNFTLNIKEAQGSYGPGWGLSQHDFMLEQALAVAIKSGADISWVDLITAQRATSEPDASGSYARKNYLYGGEYHNYLWGTAPRDCEDIYTKMVADIAAGRNIQASQKLGWLAHYYLDLTSPLHVASSSQLRAVPSGERSEFHASMEAEVGWYERRVVEHESQKWSANTRSVMERTPSEEITATLFTNTSQSVRRARLFGSETLPTVSPCTTGVRATAIRIAQKSRDNYTMPAIKAWGQNWNRSASNSTPRLGDPLSNREEAVGDMLDLSTHMNKLGANALASVILAASSKKYVSGGFDPSYKISLRGPTRDQVYKYKKKKTAAGTLKIHVKNNKGAAVEAMRLKVVWRNSKGKTFAYRYVVTPSSGTVYVRVPDAARKKTGRVKATVYIYSRSQTLSHSLTTTFYSKKSVSHKTKSTTSRSSAFTSTARSAR